MATRRNEFLDAGSGDETDNDGGYDSEAAELSKGRASSGRAPKRRKLSPASDDDGAPVNDVHSPSQHEDANSEDETQEEEGAGSTPHRQAAEVPAERPGRLQQSPILSHRLRDASKKQKQKKTPGVIYLSSLPPYLKPSALRNLLSQRGFEPITRLFLTPASKAKATSSKNSRQLYTEGWVEFASKKTARSCAESLNASPVGGKKGGFYHDDVWNMKYLRGMGWAELMAGVREERREEEGRRDEERRTIARETKGFLEGVEEGKRVDGMKRKREGKSRGSGVAGVTEEVKRTWRQFEAKGSRNGSGRTQVVPVPVVDETAKRVLGKIF